MEQSEYVADFKKTSKAILVDLLNYENRQYMIRQFKEDEVIFSKPVEVSGSYNTKVLLLEAEGYLPCHPTGKDFTIIYNRIDITQYALASHKANFLIVEDYSKVNKVKDLLPLVNETLGINLSEEELLNGEDDLDIDLKSFVEKLKENDDPVYQSGRIVYPKVTFKINKEVSLVWLGAITLNVKPKPIHIEHAIKERILKTSFMPFPHYGLS